MHELVLQAGGLVPPGVSVPADLPVDTVDARGYRHPGLLDRVVVRLVPDAIAAGVDTEMSLLGFGLADHADDIALQRRRALGFPGHALVTDPDHARYALDVMKEFKGHAKRIASKPGHAKDGFDAVAERLARQVPHFLPSYWEEVGRAFSTAGNTAYAAQSFDKARAAEREFGLEVDEERRGEAFLEFALLGALSVKSLQSYGKELQKSVGPAKGYERMFGLAVRRTLGGLPPWATLPKDLRSLAKAAKLDLDREDERLLREVLGASAIARAPAGFWQDYRPALVRLAGADPKIRARLLDVFPNGGRPRYSWRSGDSDFDDAWVQLLADAGALDALWTLDAPADALPAGGRAAWFGRYQEWAGPADGWALQLLRRAAPALRADGAPIPLGNGDWYKPLDLDLLDLVLELGLGWKRMTEGAARVDLAKWAARQAVPARAGFPAEARPRDPVRAAMDPAVKDLLAPAVDAVFGDATFEAVARGQAGLRELRREWLERQVAHLDATGLGSTALALGRLEAATRPATFAEFPEAYARLEQARVARALHRTLAIGLLDELHWPAFDLAMAELDPKPDVELKVFRQWPHLIVASGRKALVLGPAGREHEHDLKLGKDQLPDGLVWVGGQLWVGWSTWQSGYQRQAYWSGAPQDTFDVQQTAAPITSMPVVHPDALVLGAHRFSVGDRTGPPQVQHQWHDRTGAWTLDEQHRVRAIDRDTGAFVDGPPPAFLADVLDRPGSASYCVVPDGIAATSPLGVTDGQWGAKLLVAGPPGDPDDDLDDDGEVGAQTALVTLSGDRYVGTMRHGTARFAPSALVRWPGADQPRAVFEQTQWWRNAHNPSFYVADPDRPLVAVAHDATLRMGRAWLPPLLYWHYLVPRDADGSRALRSCELAAAEALLRSPTVEGVAAALPAITDDQLRAGVAHVAELAAGLAARLDKLVQTRVGGAVADQVATDEVTDQAAVGPFANLGRYWSYGQGTVTGAIRTLGRFLTRGEAGEDVLLSRLDPQDWIGRIRGVAVSASRPGTSASDREVLGKVLRAWLASGLADDGHLRLGALTLSLDPSWMPVVETDGERGPPESWRHDSGGRRLFVWGATAHDEGNTWSAKFVEWAGDGAFESWPGAHVTEERRAQLAGDRGWLEQFLAAFDANGARPARAEEAGALAEAAGVSPAEAACVLAAFPQEMDKETRTAFGLKLAEVKAAISQLRWSTAAKLDLLSEAAPANPLLLWTGGVDALAGAWVARKGKGVPVPADLLALAIRELGSDGGRLLKLAANPDQWKELDLDGTFVIEPRGGLTTTGFDEATATGVAQVSAWLCGRLPVGDPLLSSVAAVYDRARVRARHPGLTCTTGPWHMYEPKARKAAEAFFDALGGEVVPTDKNEESGEEVAWQRRSGPFVSTKTRWSVELAFRPSELDAGARELLAVFTKAAGHARSGLAAIDLLLSDDFAALVQRARETPLAAGQWEQDPTKSAPAVVEAVAARHGLSAEAAALYLQTLTLLEPTRKNVLEWNGWSAKTYLAAAAELVGRGLLLEAKRPRAGREHFLPGGWVEETAILPYEDWKGPLYGRVDGSYPLGRPQLTAPIHELFARAWARCVGDDGPRFEEVRR